MKTFLTYLWTGTGLGDRPYAPAHVNALQRAVARHLSHPHRFVCVADSTEGFAPEVEVVLTPPAALAIGKHRSPEGGRFPSCYRRLWTFSAEAAAVLGEIVLLADIDMLVLGSIDHLFEFQPTADFVGWRPFRDWGRQLRFGGGIYRLRTGTRTSVWSNFTGAASIQRARAAGFRGSDQAWISYCLAGREPYYDRGSGIYSIRDLTAPAFLPPADARIVQFNGPQKPWSSTLPWVKRSYAA
jgi:hypothetical protein